jgi:hypothetical protein
MRVAQIDIKDGAIARAKEGDMQGCRPEGEGE